MEKEGEEEKGEKNYRNRLIDVLMGDGVCEIRRYIILPFSLSCELESWRVGELESWRVGELKS